MSDLKLHKCDGPKIMLFVFALLIGAMLVAVLFPHNSTVQIIDRRLTGVTNVLSLGTMLFAATAIIVAGLAYKAAVKRPDLSVSFTIDESYESQRDLVLSVHRRSRRVMLTQPQWRIWLNNTGGASARYPVIELKFDRVGFDENALVGWKATHHGKQLGWYGFQWAPGSDMIVHPNLPMELPSLNLARLIVGLSIDESFQTTKVTVTAAADGFLNRMQLVIQMDFKQFDAIEDWLAANFPTRSGQLILNQEASGTTTVDLIWLASQLGDATAPPTYQKLCASPIAKQGYQKYFDEWRDKGIIQ